MKKILNSFRQLYSSLPLVRETQKIAQSSLRAAARQELLIRVAQESYLQTLLSQERYQDPRRLAPFERSVFCQYGEDGIVHEIFRRIGTTNRKFIEIGAGDGIENLTCFLHLQGWRGIWLEAAPKEVAEIRARFGASLSSGALKLIASFITMENSTKLLQDAGAEPDFDFLSIDIDYNTFWIWKSLSEFRPRVVAVEYNASFPANFDWKAPYRQDGRWDGTLWFGASLKSYEILGREKGYRLVACDLSGLNAYFIRDDLPFSDFFSPFDAETHYEPPRYWLKRGAGHPKQLGDFTPTHQLRKTPNDRE